MSTRWQEIIVVDEGTPTLAKLRPTTAAIEFADGTDELAAELRRDFPASRRFG